jgi:hypothetical protein
MSAPKNITVSRDYQAAQDDCVRALELLLRKSTSKAARPAPEPDDRDDVKESSEHVAIPNHNR